MSYKKTVCSILIICIIFSIGMGAFADSSKVEMKGKNPAYEKRQYNKIDPWFKRKHQKNCSKEIFKTAVAKLVEEGKLTQQQADKIEKYAEDRAAKWRSMTKEEKKAIKKEHKFNFINELMDNNIITEKEAEMIKLKVQEVRQQQLSDKLDELIEKGIITEEDSKNIKDYIVKIREERKNEMIRVREMDEKERKEYFIKYKKDRKNIFERMVKDRIITEKQAAELKKALFN